MVFRELGEDGESMHGEGNGDKERKQTREREEVEEGLRIKQRGRE